MNLEESNEIYNENKQKNTKKRTILAAIIICIIIMIICGVIIFYLNIAEENRFKMIVDGKEVSLNETFLIKDESGNNYINIKELAAYTGYKYTQGDYIEVNENKDSCYLENNYEIVTFKAEENNFFKYIKNKGSSISDSEQDEETAQTSTNIYVVKSKDGTKEEFTTNLPVKIMNEKLYIPMDNIYLACNAKITLTEKSLEIYSLDYLVKYGQGVASKQGYSKISATYENLRAIANNMLILGNDNEYGVMSLTDGKLILSVRYDDIQYVQNENKFYVYVDSKVGIMDEEGNTIISPKEYELIETFDKEKDLYLVKKEGKFGIINSSGEVILHTDFDAIGINDIDSYKTNELENKNIWHDKIIAVKKGTKYGLYNIENKNLISEFIYDGFGYKTKTTDTLGEESVLIVPTETGVEGIVLNIEGLYGIYDVNLKSEVIPCLCTRIYSITNNGVTNYYMEFNGNQLEMKEYFESHNMITAR